MANEQIQGGISGSRERSPSAGSPPVGFDPGRIPAKGRRRNLLTLANYLESLPRGYRHFDMRTCTAHRGSCKLPMPASLLAAKDPDVFLTNCGTVACAVGHGPAAGIHPHENEFGHSTFDWMGYADRAFTADIDVFEFLFGGGWSRLDNHHYGAAARIRFYLKNGLPSEWDCDPDHSMVRVYAPYRKGSRSKIRRDLESVEA